VDFPNPVAIIVARPFAPPAARLSVSHSGVGHSHFDRDTIVAAPFVCIERVGFFSDCRFDDRQASLGIRVMTHKVTHLAARAPLDGKDQRTVRFIGSVPAPLVGPPLAIPRNSKTSFEGSWRVFSKIVPVSKV
jgi:hypothetical protein